MHHLAPCPSLARICPLYTMHGYKGLPHLKEIETPHQTHRRHFGFRTMMLPRPLKTGCPVAEWARRL